MRTVIVYDSKFGNTEKIAEAIARGAGTLGGVQVANVAEARAALMARPNLLLVGGPTQRRTMSPGLLAFFDAGLIDGLVVDVPAASFDTRYKGSTWIMGSAAAEAGKRLGKAGADLVAKPESFFMRGGGPMERQTLEAGEIERAEAWGRAVAASAARIVAA
jgi:flavodoxin